MSRKGKCYDNTPMESFFKSFKTEEVNRQTYQTHEQATRAVIDYIERFYNPVRSHTSVARLKWRPMGARMKADFNPLLLLESPE